MPSFPGARDRHPFHMHDMIRSQPARVEEAIRRVQASDFGLSVARARHLVLTGCGTSFHAAMYGARILQAAARAGSWSRRFTRMIWRTARFLPEGQRSSE